MSGPVAFFPGVTAEDTDRARALSARRGIGPAVEAFDWLMREKPHAGRVLAKIVLDLLAKIDAARCDRLRRRHERLHDGPR